MMAKKARLCEDHRAVKLIMSSSDPSTHKSIGQGVRHFDSAVRDKEKQNAVLSGNYAKLYAESSHETPPFEHWQQMFGRSQSSRHSVGYRSPGGRPPRLRSTNEGRKKYSR